ncbi:unnamed protein product [Peronospora farinosa]|uniref:Uncharacterized protein n=1 Tax=Peronospora farinosa TaxID=134698 RepID=A0AAV0TYH9_9STRA|nr:unnamed protein product [Peronospora farinosa]CAI5729592.1 unnamed protein product [Peronospora farinosa]
MSSTNGEEEGRRSMQIMPNWTKYTPTVWPPPTDVVPKEPEEGDYPTHREYGAAVHLRSRVIKQWKKNFGLAQRAMALRLDTAGIDTREELAAQRKLSYIYDYLFKDSYFYTIFNTILKTYFTKTGRCAGKTIPSRMLLGKDAVEIGDMPCCKQIVANSIIGLHW